MNQHTLQFISQLPPFKGSVGTLLLSVLNNWLSRIFKGPVLCPFSDLHFLSCTPGAQPCMINYPQNSIGLQKTAKSDALGQKQGDCEAVSESGMNA